MRFYLIILIFWLLLINPYSIKLKANGAILNQDSIILEERLKLLEQWDKQVSETYKISKDFYERTSNTISHWEIWMTIVLASGVVTFATWLRGVLVP